MVNKALRIVLYSIFTISLLFVMPVNIYAETIDTHIRGRNYTYEPITYNEIQVSTNTYYENIGVFHITFELDDEYIGYVLPNYSIQYDNYFYGASSPNWGTLSKTFDRRIFVNGSSFSFDISVNWNSNSIDSAPGGDPFNYDSYNISSSDVTKYADIDSLDQIINILQDNQDIITDIELELQTVVSNTSLANDYLETISELRQYQFPIESLYAVSMCYRFNSSKVEDLFTNGYYNYPMFKLQNGDTLIRYSTYLSRDSYYIVLCSYIDMNNYTNRISLENARIISIEQLSNIGYITSTGINLQCYKITFRPNTADWTYFKSVNEQVFIPIFLGNIKSGVSTDFAITYGLTNSMLDNIQLIANGTNASSAASSQSDQANSQLQQDSNTLFTQEDSFKQNMQQSMNNIDTTFSLNNFGSSFMTSAQWVRTQYETLTNNTPFASLITFSLLVGLALIVIGKVYK